MAPVFEIITDSPPCVFFAKRPTPRQEIAAIFAPLYERAMIEAESLLEAIDSHERESDALTLHLLTFPISEGL